MTGTRTRRALSVLLLSTAALTSGCGLVQPVQPWEKGTLARPDMTFEVDRLDFEYVEHTYSSKEAASGGAGVGGGGCGCN
ncbi:MAG: hypothetical protein RIS35_3699 [Pseudomonadota bacterium]|jgi:hypothetical protein